MMAMSFKRDVEGASLQAGTSVVATATTTEDTPKSNGVFRSSDQPDSKPKMPLHSGLSALIQAATSQLGEPDETISRSHQSSSSRRNNNQDEGKKPSFSASKAPPPRYTPHGFHTTPTATAMPSQDGCTPSFAPTTLHTPTLGPESASELRRQTFPEILMTVLEDKAKADVITFLPDGKYFAVRRKEFSETTMMNYFAVASFDDFLKKIHSWGFSRIDRGLSPSGCAHSSNHTRPTGIEIFRHPMFGKGDWEKCSRICQGGSPTEVRLSALPDRARIEYTLSDESTLSASKRRLSPSHARSKSLSSASKQRLSSSNHDLNLLLQFREIPAVCKTESAETATSSADASTQDQGLQSLASAAAEDDVRSVALAITTEKLNLKTDSMEDRVEASAPLAEQAVENATHTIVADAIETLLRDEGHTRKTYLKHERELSKSSLPGVVSISKQLFSPPDAGKAKAGTVRQGQQGRDASQDSPTVTTAALIAGMRTRSTAQRSTPDPLTTTATSVLTNNNAGVVISTTSST